MIIPILLCVSLCTHVNVCVFVVWWLNRDSVVKRVLPLAIIHYSTGDLVLVVSTCIFVEINYLMYYNNVWPYLSTIVMLWQKFNEYHHNYCQWILMIIKFNKQCTLCNCDVYVLTSSTKMTWIWRGIKTVGLVLFYYIFSIGLTFYNKKLLTVSIILGA